jgi:hypothetical protein
LKSLNQNKRNYPSNMIDWGLHGYQKCFCQEINAEWLKKICLPNSTSESC